MDQGFSWFIGGFVTQFFNLIFNKFLFSFFPNPQNQVGFSRTRVECPISKKERKEGKNLFLFGLICFCRVASYKAKERKSTGKADIRCSKTLILGLER